ncbi:TrmB family transcriptional regulator [Caloranaerobacter azorensis]|uniref:TrmB family transcriptional regulator n=1 Tax=Caloranaerobacter azorensis TaxID=116090 RepID=A0A6P1YGS6_9FIRM|nr:helix-turn-helix domain-containing protein [Caloranaerobacter azorensis]QIB27973.1 TrmB family transcriptional regulator [Caloranaerobacter azorensis]
MDNEKIIEKLMEIGINKYEAKAYIALLNKPDITAYELSKLSGVPQAKIYETMSKLLDKNLVNIINDNPIKYVAVDLEGFLDSYKRKVNSTVKYLKNSLKKMDSKNKISYMLHLEGIENIKIRLKEF